MEDWISKKDLLRETGISYGQLYRWKRERLIPETWFDKRSSFTGQETFFPRALMLERVRFILDNKDRYSLTELRNLLEPESVSRAYTLNTLAAQPGAGRSALLYEAMGGGETLNHGQALAVMLAADYDGRCRPGDAALARFLMALVRWQEEGLFERSDGRIWVLKNGAQTLPLYAPGVEALWLPGDAEAEYSLSMTEISRTFTRRLNEIYEVKEYGE